MLANQCWCLWAGRAGGGVLVLETLEASNCCSWNPQLLLRWITVWSWGFPGGSDGKESACNVGDPGSIPGLGRSPGEGNGYPLQKNGYPFLPGKFHGQRSLVGYSPWDWESGTRLSNWHDWATNTFTSSVVTLRNLKQLPSLPLAPAIGRAKQGACWRG